MPTLGWLVVFCVLSLIFVLVGYRDLVGFLRIGPSGRQRYKSWLLFALWLAGLGAIYYFWWADSPEFYLEGEFWAGVLGFSLIMFLLISRSGTLRGRGPGRTYAIAWTTFREAMSQRAWLAVPIWLVGVLIVGIFVSPYRLVQDRMMLSTELLVRGQLLVAGLLILTLACRSIPQELLKQTIIVTASKPINRLELIAGKLLGFVVLAGMLIGTMGLLSYAILWYHGQQVRNQARIELQTQENEYQAGRRKIAPDADLKDIAQNGVLYAKDPIYPVTQVSFNGKFDPFFNVAACLKGGSEASVQWRFDEIPVSDRVPLLMFSFLIERVPEEIEDKENFDATAPLKIKVTAISALEPRRFRVEEELELPVPQAVRGNDLNRPVRFGTGAMLVLDPAKWYELYNRGPIVINLTFAAKGHYLYFRNESIQLRNLSPDRPGAIGQTKMYPPEHGKGVVVGRKFRKAYEIAGTERGEPEVAYWHFKNIDMKKFGPGDSVRFEIQTYREKSEVVKSHTVGLVRAMAVKPDGSITPWPNPKEEQTAGDEKLLARDWPGWKQTVIQERRPTVLNIPRKLFAKNADVYVFLACGSPQGWIAVGEKSGYLARNRRSFAGNVLRCEAIVLMQVVSIAAVSVMASSFLSWPVACFLALTIYLIGSVSDYLQSMAQFWGRFSGTLAGYAMEGLNTILPNFASYQASEYIAQGELIASAKLAELFIHTTLCTVVMLMLGYLFLRSRELAK
ncbi:MAG: hypothetical protein GWP14_07400 [Actinobacteria bacterium]|nr:hypothetical protein [Actinomycetota bacterium]